MKAVVVFNGVSLLQHFFWKIFDFLEIIEILIEIIEILN